MDAYNHLLKSSVYPHSHQDRVSAVSMKACFSYNQLLFCLTFVKCPCINVCHGSVCSHVWCVAPTQGLFETEIRFCFTLTLRFGLVFDIIHSENQVCSSSHKIIYTCIFYESPAPPALMTHFQSVGEVPQWWRTYKCSQSVHVCEFVRVLMVSTKHTCAKHTVTTLRASPQNLRGAYTFSWLCINCCCKKKRWK